MMKRFLAVLLILCMALCVVACSPQKTNPQNSGTTAGQDEIPMDPTETTGEDNVTDGNETTGDTSVDDPAGTPGTEDSSIEVGVDNNTNFGPPHIIPG